METTNLSKMKREKLLKTIEDIKAGISDENVLSDLSMIETELTKKKYGLIWEEHKENVDVELETKIPVFEEITELGIKCPDNKTLNFLLEGDNLHTLYLLEKTHKNKVDVIYIDPPYNTGKKSEWKYSDNYIDDNDGFRHSKWLSFMERRLNIAKNILKDDGYIVISIDDNEQAPLKILCDQIFGENNFICNYVWQKNFAPKNDNKYISTSHEYILMYTKNKEKYVRNLIPRSDKTNSSYSNPDNDPRGLWTSGTCLATSYSESGVFEFVTPKGKRHLPSKGRCWRYSKQKFDELLNDNRIWLGKDGNGVPRVKRFLSEMPDGIVPQTWLKYEDVGSGQDGTRDLKKIFDNEMIFSFPKPIKLIKFLLDRHINKNSIILDFFAGTGTTGQAVMELNEEDGGNRTYIMATNNENNICREITYIRLEKSGKQNLKYYKTSYIPRLNNDEENLNINLMKNIRNLIQLENGIEIDDQKIKVLFNEESVDDFSINIDELNVCEKLYVSSDILLTSEQERLFEENNIEVYIIPEYYFEDEIMEVA